MHLVCSNHQFLAQNINPKIPNGGQGSCSRCETLEILTAQGSWLTWLFIIQSVCMAEPVLYDTLSSTTYWLLPLCFSASQNNMSTGFHLTLSDGRWLAGKKTWILRSICTVILQYKAIVHHIHNYCYHYCFTTMNWGFINAVGYHRLNEPQKLC